MTTRAIILAAGEGKRMCSRAPKVLQPLGGQPMLAHVVDAANALTDVAVHVVYGHGGEQVQRAFSHVDIAWAHQAEQLGTGHAVAQALPDVDDADIALVLYGDVPLVQPQTLQALVAEAAQGHLAVLTTRLDNPAGYGRIVRTERGSIAKIVEHKDASEHERRIDEVNTGLLAAPAARLRDWVTRLSADNAQHEYYLTDVIAMAAAEGGAVTSVLAAASEVAGVNDRRQLATAEATLRARCADVLLAQGVILKDPARFDQRGTLECGKDVSIDVGCVFEGTVTLADDVSIGPHCVIRNVRIGAGTQIQAGSIIDDADIGEANQIGPYARVRPATTTQADVHIGNFVEVKKSHIGTGSKANHLTYIGDAQVGAGVNIGAGAITCNYDGINKHRTIIGDHVFVGSNSQLVAPVEIGSGVTIGAGSTVTKNVEANALALGRSRQKNIADWHSPAQKNTSKK